MHTTRAWDRGTDSGDRSRGPKAIGANLIVVGAVCALAAMALFVLVADPGGEVSTPPGTPSAVVATPAPAATGPAEQDASWLCDVVSDDSGPEARVAVAETLARGGITCAPGRLLAPQPAAA